MPRCGTICDSVFKIPIRPGFLQERVAEQTRIMGANGRQIIEEPEIALKSLTHGQATFTHHDIGRFLNTRTQDSEQFQTAY